jgi:penicillin-binding protein 1C
LNAVLNKLHRRLILAAVGLGIAAAMAFGVCTWRSLVPLPGSLPPAAHARHRQFLARNGTPLNRTLAGRFNRTDTLPLWRIPHLLRAAFIASEDKRYWQHGGADWQARFAALWANLRAGHVVRGASTIGEQAARVLHPRPRTYWSHWIAGLDSGRLLKRFGHAEVLKFYLNQVPYGGQRRGIVSAARYYFGHDPGALDPAEQLALAVLVRSPGRYDPRRHPRTLRKAVNELATRMLGRAAIAKDDYNAILHAPIVPDRTPLTVAAGPFVVYASHQARALGLGGASVRTTLDPELERFVQRTLRARLKTLASRGARNAAALVVDNSTGDVLAWAVAPKGKAYDNDPVLAPRQPGSALKPFVYGLAMTRLGWQPDTVIQDKPLAEPIGSGVHRYRNYSGRHHGRVSLRYALANSLNIPAVKTAQAVGVPSIINLLQRLGFSTFTKSADFYGPAIVLGDGAVSLFDLVQAYASLARHGRFLPLRVLARSPEPPPRQAMSPAVTSLLADILSDPDARAAEFGSNSILDLPYPTAVKTGTSSDYRDSWTMGFDNRYTVGIWMGRLGGGSMDRVTGSIGPASVLRRIFAHLRARAPYAGLWRSPKLAHVTTCEWIGSAPCVKRTDWHLPDGERVDVHPRRKITFARPLPGETLAIDPRLPAGSQRYTFQLATGGAHVVKVQWRIDAASYATTPTTHEQWQIVPGEHRVSARVWIGTRKQPLNVGPVHFSVLASQSINARQK